MRENQFVEKKSLRIGTGKTASFKELAKDCVCFANSRGGIILIGIEDKEKLPPLGQIIDENLPFAIKKKIAEHTVNVGLNPSIKKAENGAEYIELEVLFSAATIASTSDGKYYYRSGDTCVALLPDELSRLFTDKPAYVWETKKTRIQKSEVDADKLKQFQTDIKNSSRVSIIVKQKSIDELLDYYKFSDGDFLTNLGVLWLGNRRSRGNLLYSPTIHFFKFDADGHQVNKIFWDDASLNPKELIEAVWTEIPDWKEGVDVSDGMFRKFVPNYEEEVIRELMANALVHRPYTMRGDIFINLYHDKLEVVNPGLFPIGVTVHNVLHKNVRRNEALAQVFYDVRLMDKEGSGVDKMYQVLLSNSKHIPEPYQGDDFVQFTIRRHIIKPEIISFINRANEEFQLNMKEIISLGLIAQHNALSSLEFSKQLDLPDQFHVITHWIGRLIEMQIVVSKGKTKGTQYLINPEFLKAFNFKGKATLKSIDKNRLEELIYKVIQDYQPTSFSDIHERIGKEINIHRVRRILKYLCESKIIRGEGEKKFRKYSIEQKTSKNDAFSAKSFSLGE